MIDGKTLFILGLLAIAVYLGTRWHKSNERKLEEKRLKRLADIKANPQNYYVYEGGTKPNPPMEEEPARLTDE